MTEIFGQALPARAKLCWGLSVEVGTPSARKQTNSVGRSGLAPNSSSASNWTCILGFSSFCGEASCWHVQFLGSKLRPSREQWSCSFGQSHVGLGDCLWHEGEELCHCLHPLLPLEWVFLPLDWECMPCGLASRAGSSSPSGPWEHLWVLKDTLDGPLSPCRQHGSDAQRAPFIAPS